MQVTNKIEIHLDDKRLMPPVDAVQGDACARVLEFTLYSGGKAWNVPDGADVWIGYRGTGGCGMYNKLSDDDGAAPAYSVSGNVVTVTLIPQVTAVAGFTELNVIFRKEATGQQIATFGILIKVARNAAIGAGTPENYFDIRQWVGAGPMVVEFFNDNGSLVASYKFSEIQEAHSAGRTVICLVPYADGISYHVQSLFTINPSVAIFADFHKNKCYSTKIKPGTPTDVIEFETREFINYSNLDKEIFAVAEDGTVSLKPDFALASDLSKYALSASLRNPLYVEVTGNETGGYSSTHTFAQITAAKNEGRSVICIAGVGIGGYYAQPLVAINDTVAVFQMTTKSTYVRTSIKSDGTITCTQDKYALLSDLGKYALTSDLGNYALASDLEDYVRISDLEAQKATDAKYFSITDDGLLYLQPEYRGEGSADYEYSISNNGVGNNGSKIEELPETIIIPEIVNEIAVTALADGMFCKNKRVKSITIPACITEIPEYFCYSAQGLIEVNGTENVQVMKSRAFSNTALKKVSFPALELLDGDWHFNACGLLVSADLGNKITAISAQCFDGCYRLSALRNAQNVTSVGARAFYRATRLLPPAFLPKLKNIGDYGFMRCRVVYDWASLHENECTFGTKATTLQINPTDFWSECTPVPCEIPMRSTFTQRNPAWSNETVDNTGTKYKNGCITVCSAMVYSVLEGKDMASPQEFMDAVSAANPDLLSLQSQTIPNQIEYWNALGYDGTQKTFDTENLQLLYDTLAAGTPVIVDVLQPSGGHMVVVHGINEKGEVLVVDPESTAYYYGDYRPMTYSITIQNLTDWGFSYFFVTKR